MSRVVWGMALNSVIAALCLHLQAFPAEPEKPQDGPEASTSCETSKNHNEWYLRYRECGDRGTQVSLLANVATEDVRGGQYSLLANIAAGDLESIQMATTLNIARSAGAQIFGDVNIAQRVRYLQFGGVNIADTAEGTQVGFVNIANRLDGFGIGFLTLAGNGLLHVDVTAEETGMQKLTFASGRGLFTSYSLGYAMAEGSHPYSFGFGAGYHRDFGALHAEGEFHGSLVLDRHTSLDDLEDEDKMPGDKGWRHNTLFQGKLRMGGKLLHHLGVFGGVTYNVLAFGDEERLTGPWTDGLTGSNDDVAWWPGFEVGIRLGR